MLVGHKLLKLFSYQAKLHLHFVNDLWRHLEEVRLGSLIINKLF